MSIDNWINLAAAILVGGGTLTLAVMTWKSIRQTRSIQKAEKRDKLLNEIIEWATLISSQTMKTPLFEGLPDVVGDSQKHGIYIYSSLSRVRANLWGAVGKNIYMLNIAHLFGLNLSVSIATLVDDMTSYMEFLDTWQEKSTKMLPNEIKFEEDEIDEIDTLSNCVNVSAISVIEQATKIKTGDIGKKEENMSEEGENVVSDKPTLEDIEEHLKSQDKQMARGTYFSGYLFGAMMIFISFSLLAGKYILTTELGYAAYALLLLIGGTGLMVFTWNKRSKHR